MQQQTPVSALRDGANDSWDFATGDDGKEPQTDKGRGQQPARGEVQIVGGEHFVETLDALVQLGAHAADEEIAKPRKLTKYDRGTVLRAPVGLNPILATCGK